MALQTNSFRISRYILLALVLILCIGIIVWTFINNRDWAAQSDTTVDNVIHITNNDPCVQNINNAISQLWAYTPNQIPQKYQDMITQYMNEKITTRQDGYCNDTKFTCRPGQTRRDCDPCAAGSARQFAQEQHIADTIAQECN